MKVFLKTLSKPTLKFVSAVALALVVGACATSPQEEQVEPGRGTDEYKRSLCAAAQAPGAPCLPQDLKHGDEEWLRKLKAWQQGVAS